MASRRVLGVNK